MAGIATRIGRHCLQYAQPLSHAAQLYLLAPCTPCCRDHLDLMFGPEAPPLEWDTEGAYSRGAIEVYYLSNGAAPLTERQLEEVYFGGWPEGVTEEGPQRYGPNAAAWVRVKESWTLRDALSRPDHVVPGVPAFFVLAKGSDFRQRFLDGDLPLF